MSRDRFSVLWSGITWWSMGTRPDLGGGRGLVWFGLLIWDCKQSHSQVSTHGTKVHKDWKREDRRQNSLFKFGYQPIRDQYFLIRSVSAPYILACVVLKYQTPNRDKPDTRNWVSIQQIRARYLDHVTGYQPIRDQYSLLCPSTEKTGAIRLEDSTPVEGLTRIVMNIVEVWATFSLD
eukprot:sb/3471785/